MHALLAFALRQRLLMLVLTVLLIGAGVRALRELPIDAFPDVSTTQVKIIVKAPGMTPEEVETRITAPIEVEMLGIPRQTMLRSVSKYALTDVTIDFEESADIYWARQQVAERLNGVWGSLPPGISGGMAPMTTPLGEALMFLVQGEQPLVERRSVLDWVIRPNLRAQPGVADINALGGQVRSFEVVPDPGRLYGQGLSLAKVQEAIALNNRNDGAGRLVEGEETLLVRSEGNILKIQDIENTVVKPHPVEPVRIGDVAEVQTGALTRYGAVTVDGKAEGVQGLVLSLRGANARELVKAVEQKLHDLASTLPKGMSTEIFYNRGDLVQRAMQTVSAAMIEAIVLVLILLMLFLGDLRAALTVALILPLSALGTFLLMRYFDLSANLMSLGGLAIAIGMLVDAAVVVVENIVAHLAHAAETPEGHVTARLQVVLHAAQEVAVPITSGIAIILIVFLPLLSLEGLEGKLFGPVALTIVFALSASLALSLTVIPALASLLLRSGVHRDPWLVRWLARVYAPVLDWSLRHGRAVVGIAVVSLAIAVAAYSTLGKAFIPTLDEGTIIVETEILPSISLEESVAINLRIEKAILEQVPEIAHAVGRTGSDELGLDPMGLNQTDVFLIPKPQEEWLAPNKEAVIDKLRTVLAQFPGVTTIFTQPIEMRVSEMLTGVRGDVAVKIFGTDLNELNKLAEQIHGVLRQIPGAQDVYTARNEGVQYLRVAIDRMALGRLGLNVDELTDTLRSYVEGRSIGTVYEGARRTPLILRGDPHLRHSPAEFANLMLTVPDGRNIPLTNVARIERVEGPVVINRELGQRMAVIIANVSGRDLVGFVEEARQRVGEQVALPPGYQLHWGGQFENQQRAAARLGLVVPAAIGLIFLLLYTTFGSVRQAVLILTNVPFALVGGVIALWLAREYLSVPASVGFIALLGIAVLNGVVLVSYYNQLIAQGRSSHEAVVEGSLRRLRPVLMTASIAALGLVPLLFATGPGSEIQRPLAIVVIGGLISSTLLTLVLLPILYRRFGLRLSLPSP